MKALKEKRFSLRSFLRGGIVILSLLALAFVSCGESGSDEPAPTGPTGSTGTTDAPPVPTRHKAVSIYVQGAPTALNYQGAEVDLAGYSFVVTWDDSSTPKFYDTKAALVADGLAVVPPYCDWNGEGAAAGYFYIVDPLNGKKSNDFTLKGVLPLADKGLKADGTPTWYSDRRPDFSGITLTGTYNWKKSASGDTWPSASEFGASPTAYTNDALDVYTTGKKLYTAVDYPNIKSVVTADDGVTTVTVTVGKNNTASGAVTTDATFKPTYYRVVKVEAVTPLPDAFFMLDDITKYSKLGLKEGLTDGKDSNSQMAALFASSGIKFKVYYNNDQDGRVINWDEFVSNTFYWNQVAGKPANYDAIFFAKGMVDPVTQYVKYDDDYNWTFRVNYVPTQYGVTIPGAGVVYDVYSGYADVSIPVYEFIELEPVSRATGYKYADSTAPWSPNRLFMAGGTAATASGVYNNIKQIWQLTGVYQRGSDRKTSQKIDWAPAMFDNARGVGSGVNFEGEGQGGNGTISQQLKNNVSGQIPGGWLFSGLKSGEYLWDRGWPLPIVYRGSQLSDETETVIVDLYILGPQGNLGQQ